MLERIKEAIINFRSQKKIDKKDLEVLLKEIQRALILADVNVKIVLDITEKIKRKIYEEKPENIPLRDYAIKAIYEVLTDYLGKEKRELNLKRQRILVIGLYGAGKTTTAAKIAYYFKKRNLSVCLVCADIHRPAAYDQLESLAKKINVSFYGERNSKNVIEIIKNAIEKCKEDVMIIDSAGRDSINEELLNEIKKIYEISKPEEVFLVMGGDIGSSAKDLVEKFKETIPITGIVLTKMDSSAKGGGALVASYLSGANVVFLGTGEKIEDLECYDPKGFVSRLLGLGDLNALLERIKELEEEYKEIKHYIERGEYNMYVFYEQIRATQKMGSFQKILDMIPGASMIGIKKDELENQERKIRKWKYIIDSMTKEERLHPEIINASRIKRIARGSGTKEEEVRELLKAYKTSEKIFRGLRTGKFLKDPRLKKFLKAIPKEALQSLQGF